VVTLVGALATKNVGNAGGWVGGGAVALNDCGVEYVSQALENAACGLWQRLPDRLKQFDHFAWGDIGDRALLDMWIHVVPHR
jgi:hypothetical protein